MRVFSSCARVISAVLSGARHANDGASVPSAIFLLEPSPSFPPVKVLDARPEVSCVGVGADSGPFPPPLSLPLVQSSASCSVREYGAPAPMLLSVRGHAAQSLRAAAASSYDFCLRQGRTTEPLLGCGTSPSLRVCGTGEARHASVVWSLPPLVSVRVALQSDDGTRSASAASLASADNEESLASADREVQVGRETLIGRAVVELPIMSLSDADGGLQPLASAAAKLARDATSRYMSALRTACNI